ncbi:helix-turn-helix domain protein [Paraburkholderia xenovorans LB400]|uniref:Transcriptional regulator, AraC family n=1 Tax=Paraburkholderia xenovorans (strain LB400) TaxID=266265 RepID=Q13G29_PARXL|nr:helix-turn-helix domain-containing protein [Paraburkholderia xenovorans]ABE36960.1 transcriptional regulator, AraC family [Paraburkholderia xenovorans LB400]AIP34754.1 helix-turn-helix domain protein [Paraburkholderia xenovorans LB400]
MAVFFARRNRYATQTQIFQDDRAKKRIGIALFNGFSLPEAATVVEIFQSANALCLSTRMSGPCYDVHLLSMDGGRIASSSSVFVCTDTIKSGGRTDEFHALFIAAGAGVHSMLSEERLVAWLHRLDLRSERIFPIAEKRLLLDDTRSSDISRKLRRSEGAHAVAWNGLKAPVSQRTSTPLRAALAMIEEDFGAEAAREIASSLQLRFEAQLSSVQKKNMFSAVSEKIQSSAQWLEMNCGRAITIEEAAQFVAMSERNFLRRFKMEMGVTPSDYLLYVRVDKCCRLLFETDLPVDKIARRCGMGSGGQLSKVFRKYLGATPTEYRASKRSFS